MADLAVNASTKPRRAREGFAQGLILSGPAIFLAAFCVTPLMLLLQLSFAHHTDGGLWTAGFEFSQYRQLADPTFLRVAAFSLGLAATTAILTVSVAFPPAVTLNASALTLSLGSSTTLTWSSSDTTSCTATGAWSGNKAASGSQEVKPVTAGSQTYSLSCGGLNGYDTQSVVVTVRAPAAGSSGGGAAGVDMLLGLGLLGLVRRTLRRR